MSRAYPELQDRTWLHAPSGCAGKTFTKALQIRLETP
jgi:hypothetical protein